MTVRRSAASSYGSRSGRSKSCVAFQRMALALTKMLAPTSVGYEALS